MPKVVGIKFDTSPKIYSFSAGDIEYRVNDQVVVETSRGAELGVVQRLPYDLDDKEIIGELKSVLRIATSADLNRAKDNEKNTKKALVTVTEKVRAHKLKMKVVNVQYTIDGAKLIVYFSADGRVDFRDLVKDLASTFHLRIELHQISEREECRMLGGLGVCGRKLCCASGCDFAKVNIKMAKNQNLSLNPQKISGCCGRLMCCLSYENDYYVEANKLLPKQGSEVLVNGEKGQVIGLNQLKMLVKVKVETSSGYEICDYPLDEITVVPRQQNANEQKQGNKKPQEYGGKKQGDNGGKKPQEKK